MISKRVRNIQFDFLYYDNVKEFYFLQLTKKAATICGLEKIGIDGDEALTIIKRMNLEKINSQSKTYYL